MNKIFNQPWMESIRLLEKKMSAISNSLQTPAMKSAMESMKLTSFSFHESSAMRAVMESAKLSSFAFHQSPAIRSVIESNKLASLSFQESAAMASMRDIGESTRLASLVLQESATMKSIRELSASTQLASLALQESPAMQAMRQINELASIKALKTLENSPFNILAIDFVTEKSFQVEAPTVIDQYLEDAECDIASELASCNDFELLSDKTKNILLYIYHTYFLPVFLSCCAAIIMLNLDGIREKLKISSTAVEVKAIVKGVYSANIDRSFLSGYRVTIVKDLHLRNEPSMKSEVIEKLPIGTLVEIIDKTNRSWLLVDVEINGETEQGWVSRKHTTYFK